MRDLDHVLWIGGCAGAGKTTVARRIAQRWGLRLYSSDNWTWVHRDRAIEAGVPAAIMFEALTAEERAVAPVEERTAMWLGEERAAMVLDDVRLLRRAPLVLAEGGVIPPALIDPARAVWLAPTKNFQLQHRHLDWVTIGFSAAEARGWGIPTIDVDGKRSACEIAEEVAAIFADHLQTGPLAQSRAESRALLREANLAAIKQVRDGCARSWSSADSDGQLRSFVCECGAAECHSDVDVTVAVAAPKSSARRPPPLMRRGYEPKWRTLLTARSRENVTSARHQ